MIHATTFIKIESSECKLTYVTAILLPYHQTDVSCILGNECALCNNCGCAFHAIVGDKPAAGEGGDINDEYSSPLNH